MALTRITKGVIKPNENYDTHNINSTGIVTAIGLDVNGNADISGSLSVGGVLTYEDVTSIDSVGIITARTGLVSPYADIDDFVSVGSNIHLGNAGVVTATSFVGSGAALTGIDATAIKDSGGNVKVQAQASGAMYTGIHTFSSGAEVGSNIKLGNAGVITATSFVGSGAALTGIDATAVKDSGGNVKIQAQASGAVYTGIHTFGTNTNFTDIDVDGHTNLDNLNIAGVSTFAGTLNASTVSATTLIASGDIDVDGHTNLDNVSIAGVVTATSFVGALPISNDANNRVITATGSGGLNGEANFTFSGNTATITASSGYALVANGASTGIGLGSNGAIVFGNQNVAAYATGLIDASELKLNISGSNRINLKSSVLLIGNTSSQEVYGTNAVQIQGTTAGASSLSLLRHGNSPYLTLGSSGGSSLNAVTALSNDNRIGQINFAGADGTDINTHAASIAAYVDGSVSSNNVPARIIFATGPSETERLRIGANGYTKIGSGTPKAQLDVKQQGNSWEDAVLIQHDNANTGWNIHAERTNSALWIGYNSNTASALTDQTATQVVHLHSNRTTSLVTSNNSYELTIGGLSGGPTLWLRDSGTSGTPRIMFGSSAAALDGAIYYNISSNYMSFYTNGTEHIRIDQPGNLNPVVDASRDLGTSSLRWRNVYTTDLQLSNENTGGNEVDGTEGNWTLQEGETDVYMINRKTGKKYKMMLQEVS